MQRADHYTQLYSSSVSFCYLDLVSVSLYFPHFVGQHSFLGQVACNQELRVLIQGEKKVHALWSKWGQRFVSEFIGEIFFSPEAALMYWLNRTFRVGALNRIAYHKLK